MDLREIKARMDLMVGRRRNYERSVQEISDLCMPYRGDITTKGTPGEDRLTAGASSLGVFDTTGILTSDAFVNFLKATIFPATQEWIRGTLDEPLGRQIQARQQSDAISSRLLREAATSNFYSVVDSWLRDFAILGTGTIYVEWDPKRGFVFLPIPWSRMWVLQGMDGSHIAYKREAEVPAIEAFRHFNGKPGTRAMKSLNDNKPMELITYNHFVWKNENGTPGIKSPEKKPWVSHWIVEGEQGLESVRTRGQDLPPYICARWMQIDGEEYGRGQGHIARPDLKGVNKLKELTLDAAGMALKPPFMVEDETQVDLDIGPDGLVLVRPYQKVAPQWLTPGADFNIANEIGVQDRTAIRAAFLADLIDDPEFQDRSAAAVRDRQIRAAQRLAPRADKIYHEMLIPLVSLMMQRMDSTNSLPELQTLRDLGSDSIGFEFVSPFFTAQKEAPMVRTQAWIQGWADVAALTQKPEILDKIDLDAAIDYSADLSDIPAVLLRDEDGVEELRGERQQQIEQQRALDQAEQAAKAVSQLPEGQTLAS